jgi:hypothetical protein
MNQSGFNQNPYPGYNPAITQQPNVLNRRQTTLRYPYDYTWYDKPSQNGEFKYGLCGCCSGTSCEIAPLVMCPLFWPFLLVVNGEVAEVVGK